MIKKLVEMAPTIWPAVFITGYYRYPCDKAFCKSLTVVTTFKETGSCFMMTEARKLMF